MNAKGFAPIALIAIVGAVLVIGGLVFYKLGMNQSSSNTPVASLNPTSTPSQTSQPTVQPTPQTGNSTPVPVSTNAPGSNCNTAKDVCFNMSNPNINIQEGYLEDSDNWISTQLMLTGKGSGGYQVSISGFPSQFSVRVPDQNFADGTSEKIYLEAQKDATQKGTYHGTISVRSYITNVTTTASLTINYINWDSSAIHTDPAEINVDCTIHNYPNSTNKELDCGTYDSMYLKFYYYRNNKTIEVRTNVENSASRSLSLSTEYDHATTFTNQDITTLYYQPEGFNYNNLEQEPGAVYKGYFSFLDQTNQQEVLHIPYTMTVHAYNP